MGALSLALALALATPAGVGQWQREIEAAAARCIIPAGWIARVMAAESGGRTHHRGRPIRSAKGAIGLMQLMPGTWTEMQARLGLGPDPDDPADNIVAGSCYLQMMHERFGYPGLFAAYHAGPARYAAHLRRGTPLPGETLPYLRAVTGEQLVPATRAPPPPSQALFALRRTLRNEAQTPHPPSPGTLFAIENRRD
ncbi:MAG TPA: lytic transglycosylase domain-containing protein [Sphingomonas sp.]|nr:lytic transglycosylase domain-containing protein [Sphingomonas sp.]